ncbi:hypothetical protein [Aequorivita sinensis]|uniref:hypothetical protein n=1 Tax=Aequorivita sinensis TaxID=1382458 RepID=UPI00111FA514|nr:hypothetical protein [Aequorivita sinensis]
MNFKKLIFLFTLALATISCSSDDDGPSYKYKKENLTGTYSLTSFKSKDVKTENLNGFNVVTTTTLVGDTFGVNVVFDQNNIVTLDGTYRINKTVKQGEQTNTETYIVVLNNESSGYSVNETTSELTIDGDTYKVSNFNINGFTLNLAETTTEPNGNNSVYTEELKFSKQ